MNAFSGRVKLSTEEVSLVRDALESTQGKETAGKLRDLEKQLIAFQVDGLVDEGGFKQEAAIGEAAAQRQRSIRHIRTALARYGKRRRSR